MNRILRRLFFDLIVQPVVLILLGLNVRNRERLPLSGPAIIVANHNSHLDTLALITLLPSRLLHSVHPVAAADYFLKNKMLAWFATEIIGIIPVRRGRGQGIRDPLSGAAEALERGDVLILFPEGSRGEPGVLQEFKRGVALLAKRYPDVPVIPIYLDGLDRVLPKGEALFVPFFCDVAVGEHLHGVDDTHGFTERLEEEIKALSVSLQRVDG